MKKILKLLTLSVISLFAITTAKSQCTNPCSIQITNEIDCDVKLRITFMCNGALQPATFYNPPMGNSSSPSVTTLPSVTWSGCPCANITIVSIEVFTINGCPPIGGPVPLNSVTSTINQPPLCGCCPTNYGTFTGCNVRLWMSCP